MKEEDMAVRERLKAWAFTHNDGCTVDVDVYDPADPTDEMVGRVEVDILNDNVVVTIRRIDEAKFGPVSVVVV